MCIIIISDNKKNIENINKLLSPQEFLIKSLETFDHACFSKNCVLIVADISSLDPALALPENFCKNINKAKSPVLLILSYTQAKFLYSSILRYNDFVFLEHLGKELEPRTRKILPNMNDSGSKNRISFGEMSLNTDKYELTVSNRPIELTYKEYHLLKLLLENQNKAFSRSRLLSVVWEYDFYGGSRTVDVHIRRLRAKLPSPYNQMLKTVRNVGYMFSPDLT